VDGGVSEECDDGNQVDGDACTGCKSHGPTTTLPQPCRFDEESGECRGSCDEAGAQCVVAVGGGCTCTTAVCFQCFFTPDGVCSGSLCGQGAGCPGPNALCNHPIYSCPAAECPCCPVCGDDTCEFDESQCSCPEDCGPVADPDPCLPLEETCGDLDCQPHFGVPSRESRETCPQDCKLACVECSG
jgi:hypothetical protein